MQCGVQKVSGTNENFAVILPDDIILSKIPAIKQLMRVHLKTNGGSVLGLESVPKRSIKIRGDKNKKRYENYFSISNLVEKPIYSEAPSNLTVVGRYLLNSKVLITYLFKKRLWK